jgi:hypothetical protein
MSSDGDKRKGFASMSPDERKVIAAQGGKTAHAQGRAHKWSPEEARAAGKKSAEARLRRKATE